MLSPSSAFRAILLQTNFCFYLINPQNEDSSVWTKGKPWLKKG